MQDPPESVDILELEFKLEHKVRVFNNTDIGLFCNPTNSIVSSSKYGLIFISTPKCEINVIPLHAIAKINISGECGNFPYRVVNIPGIASHININCDNTVLSVTVRKPSSLETLFYKVESFLTADISLIQHVNLSNSQDICVLNSGWNPAVPNVYSVCKSDGSLDIYELQNNGLVEKIQLPKESDSRCFSWSPKGKQIAVGSGNGSITQYKPDLRAVKVIASPPLIGSMVCLHWISNYQFIAIYSSLSATESLFIVIDAPKSGTVVYTNYDDICYSHGNIRSKQFYMHYLLEWNTIIVASSNSCEVGVLGLMNNQWTQLILTDSARAELPLSTHSNHDTFPIGFVVDFTFTKGLWPYLLLLSNEGLLCCYTIVNTNKNAKSLCYHEGTPPYSDLLFEFHDRGESLQVHEDSKKALCIQDVIQRSEPRTDIIETVSTISQITQPVMNSDSIAPTHFQHTTTISTTSNKELCFPSSLIDKNKYYCHEKHSHSKLMKLLCINFCRLEIELTTILYKCCIKWIAEDDSVNVIKLEISTRKFVSEMAESLRIHGTEVIILKQRLVQSWSWYEDVKSKLTICSDPSTTLMRCQPLDIVSQRQLDNIHFLLYYIESQLIHGLRSLDEEWELFQMSCRESSALQLTSTEMIYRAMVKHDGTLQKQAYIMKDISTRIQVRLQKQSVSNMLLSTKRIESLETLLKITILDSHDIVGGRRNARLHLFMPKKIIRLRTLLESHHVIYVANVKNSIVRLTASLITASASVPSSDTGFVGCVDLIIVPSCTNSIKCDVSKIDKNVNVSVIHPNDISFPYMSTNQYRHIHPRQSLFLKGDNINSAFTAKIISRQQNGSDVISQSKNQSSFNFISSSSIAQQAESLPCSENIFADQNSNAKAFNKTTGSYLKHNTMQQMDCPRFNNEHVSKSLNELCSISYAVRTDNKKIHNREILNNKKKSGSIQSSGNLPNLFTQSSTHYTTPAIFDSNKNAITMPCINNRTFPSSLNILDIEEQNADMEKQNNRFSKAIPSDTFVSNMKYNDAYSTNNTHTVPINHPHTKDFIQDFYSITGNPMQPTSASTQIYDLNKAINTTSRTALSIPSSTYSIFGNSTSGSCLTTKHLNKEENIFEIVPNTTSNIANAPPSKLSIPKSETIITSSCAMPVEFTSNLNIIPLISKFQSKSLCENPTSALIDGNKVDARIRVSNANTFDTTPFENSCISHSVSISTKSNSLINTSKCGPIFSTGDHQFNNNITYVDTTAAINNTIPCDVITNSFGTSDVHHTGFLLGSFERESSTKFEESNSYTCLNKNILKPASACMSTVVTCNSIGNVSITCCNISANSTKSFTPSSDLKFSTKTTTTSQLNNTPGNLARPEASPANFRSPNTIGTPLGRNNGSFGSAPTFISVPGVCITKLDSPRKVFGTTESATTPASQQNSTFAKLANQNIMEFGNLSPTSKASSFTGGTAFSSWR